MISGGKSWAFLVLGFPKALGRYKGKKKKILSISSKQKEGVYSDFLVPIPSGCLPSHCLYFPLLEGDNLINSSTLKGLQVTECVEQAGRLSPPKLHGWGWKTTGVSKEDMELPGRGMAGEKPLENTYSLWFVWLWFPPPHVFFFPFLFLVPIWAGFSVTAPEKHHYCHEGSTWSSWVGRQGLWFSWVTDELYDLGECHFTSVVLAFVL